MLAVTGTQRMPALPKVSTMTEQGIKDEVFRVTGWVGMSAPAKTPADVLTRVATEVRAITAQPDVREKMATLGFDSMPMGVTESPAYVGTQLGRYKAMVQAAGAQAD